MTERPPFRYGDRVVERYGDEEEWCYHGVVTSVEVILLNPSHADSRRKGCLIEWDHRISATYYSWGVAQGSLRLEKPGEIEPFHRFLRRWREDVHWQTKLNDCGVLRFSALEHLGAALGEP